MKIFKFQNEGDYEKAMELLMQINEEHPPEPVQPSYAMIAGDLQAGILKDYLGDLGIQFTEEPNLAEFPPEENPQQ